MEEKDHLLLLLFIIISFYLFLVFVVVEVAIFYLSLLFLFVVGWGYTIVWGDIIQSLRCGKKVVGVGWGSNIKKLCRVFFY